MTVATEEARIRSMLHHIEVVESVSATLPAGDERRRQLEETAQGMVSQLEPIRVEIAAKLLDMSDKTVRAWHKEGVLTAATEEPRLLLDPERLHEVMHLVHDLREAGKTRGLLDMVWYRLGDQALLESEDLKESLAQMTRGEGRLLFDEFGQSTKDA
jgi:DNA-binding transcriptional MerR regulator